jgi:hypothetical protein
MIWTQAIYGTLELITFFILLELLQRRRELGYLPRALPKEPRPLKPRSPLDCPVCRHPQPKPLWGHAHRPGALPWPQRKSQVPPQSVGDNSARSPQPADLA